MLFLRSRARVALPALAVLFLAACQTAPRITSQTAPQADLRQYHTYAFMEKLSSDADGYTSINTQLLKASVARELAEHGLTPSENPDLQVNLLIVSKDKIEGRTDPRYGVSYGHWGWGRSGWGVGLGLGDRDIRSVREDTLTVDLVEKSRNLLVWSGSAAYQPTQKEQNDATARIDDAIGLIFDRFPSDTKKVATTH
jgi:hypothetical protein